MLSFFGGIIISCDFSLTFKILSTFFDLIKSPVVSADLLIIFLPAVLPNSLPCFLMFDHIYFD